MAKDQEPKPKSGFTVGEIEGRMRKYGLEIALCVVFILTAIFTLVWGGAMLLWSILLAMIFGIIGVLVPKSMHKVTIHSHEFVNREKITSIIIAVIAFLIAIFLPPIIFAIVGLMAGKSFSIDADRKGTNFDPDSKDDNEEEDH